MTSSRDPGEGTTSVPAFVDRAGHGLRAPRAAGIAGIAFAVLFTASLLILRTLPIAQWTDEAVVAWFTEGHDLPATIAALYLAPFSGIAFPWLQSFWDWTILVLPAWVAFVSLFILRRERSPRRTIGR